MTDNLLAKIQQMSRKVMQDNKDLIILALGTPDLINVIKNTFGVESAEEFYNILLKARPASTTREPSKWTTPVEEFVQANMAQLIETYQDGVNFTKDERVLHASFGATITVPIDCITIKGKEISSLRVNARVFLQPLNYKAPKKTATEVIAETTSPNNNGS